jgi:hypothetical protein
VGVGERLAVGLRVGCGMLVGAGVSTGCSVAEEEGVARSVAVGLLVAVKALAWVAVRVLLGTGSDRLGTSMMIPLQAKLTRLNKSSKDSNFLSIILLID